MTEIEKEKYDFRSQLGDIIIVRSNDWSWGNAEGLPDFVLVKIPDMTFEEAKQYEKSLTNLEGKPVRKRKWRVPSSWINTIISQGGIITLNKSQVVSYLEAKVL